MSARRETTLVVDFSVLSERPKLDIVQRFVEKGLGLGLTDYTSIQLHNIRHCVLIEMMDPASAIKTAQDHHLKHAIRLNPTKKIAIPVYVDDNTVDVRVHDLPPDMPNNKIAEAMLQYGEVLTIRDEVWKNFFSGVPNGVRVLKMKLSKPVPSFVTICDQGSLATHPGQILTCRRCGLKRHLAKTCSEAAKKNTTTNKKKEPQQQIQPAPCGLPILPIVVESQVVAPHTEDNGNDGFTTVVKKNKPKRQLSKEGESAEKRTCLDEDDDDNPSRPDTDNEHSNDNGQQITTPKRRTWKTKV